jgi:hypothetical protein
MKPFQNPYVVGGLALVAVGLICRNAIVPLWGRIVHRSTPTPTEAQAPVTTPPVTAVAAPSNPPTAEAAVAKGPRIVPEMNIDLTQTGWKFSSSPHRDPFQINPATITNLARLFPAASELLSLTAIWRQTGSSLALINGKIVGGGDNMVVVNRSKTGEAGASYKYMIDQIDGDSVWLQGPAGREQLEFKSIAALNVGGSTNLNIKVGPKMTGTAMR